MTEAEGVLAGCAVVGPDQLLADQREQVAGEREPPGSGASSCTAPRWKTCPSTAPRSSTSRSSRPSRSRRAAGAPGSSAARRPRRAAVVVTHPSISSTNSGLPSAAGGSAPRSRRRAAPRPRGASMSARLSRRRAARARRGGVQLAAAPAGPQLEQLRPGDAQQEDRRVARPVRDVLDQVEERRLRPLDVVEDDERPFRAGLEQLAERERRPRRGEVPSTLVRLGAQPEQDLDERPVGDALAVVEAAAAQHSARPPAIAEELLDEPRLADPGRPEQREQVARAPRATSSKSPASAAAPARDRRSASRGVGPRAARRVDRDEPVGRRPARALPFSSSGSTASTVTASRTSAEVSAPIRISPGAAACSSRAAMFTASPVTSVVRPRRPRPRRC